MKKILFIMLAALGLSSSAFAGDDYSRDASVLPEAARTTINNNFKAKVSVVKIEKTLGHVTEYETVLTDGTEISFDNNGNWDNIEVAGSKSVPNSMVPQAIRNYIAKHQPKTHIVGIEKERSGYEIELSNGVDMKFNNDGEFLRYD